MITNKYLFSSQFISYLKKQKVSAVDTYEGFSKSIKSLIETKKQIENSDIINILSQLQFACSSMERDASNKSAHFCYLYDGFPLKKKVSCLYFINDDLLIDKNSKGSYPVFSLIYLMKKENLEWGILTTGKKWRLYSVLTAQPYENYIEIDFNNYEEEDIKLFWQLFSLTLFLPDENSVTPLEKFIEESEKEAKVIEDHIKNNIDIILENICWGFLTYSGKENIPLDDVEKQIYFDNAVYLLFRLLFVLYAESRALLPMSAPEYQKKSLNNLIIKAKDYIHNGITDPDKTELWDSFRDLCIDIDSGNSEIGIPEYDGGLFDSREHSFLSDKNNKLKDGYFYKILYNLGFMIKSKNEIYIDYKDLSVRSLGSLYEGILEYKLFIADEEMVIRRSDNKTVIKTSREAGAIKKSDRVIEKGNVYFSQDAFERHDTGAYYTPEDVVNYMVSNSVRLGLEERWIQFHDTVKKYEKELITAINDDIKNGLLKKFDRELLNFIEEKILTFKIIDPAMGSGHFLVNSLNTVTHFIIEVLQNRVIISNGPIKHEIIPADVDWNLFAHINESINCDPAYWRRKVSEKCIFGIDINFLAVELAKLSIWIATAAEGKPLTFLNHHLKCGDSIIGVRISDIQEYPKTAKEKTETYFTDIANETAIKEIKEQFIRMLADDSDVINQVDSKKDKYDEIQRNVYLNQLKDVATIWLMASFYIHAKKDLFAGASIIPDESRYYEIIKKIGVIDNLPDWTSFLGEKLYNEIKQYQKENKVYHWELEFPEIIGDGFEAVVGNPPYVDVKAEDYCGVRLECLESRNLYSYIGERGIVHLNKLSSISFIVPLTLSCTQKMFSFRNVLIEKLKYLYILNFSDRPLQIFKNVRQRINIFIGFVNNSRKSILSTKYLRFENKERNKMFNKLNFINCIDLIKDNKIPRIDNNISYKNLSNLLDNKNKIKDFILKESNFQIFFHGVCCYWTKAYDFIPEYFSNDGKKGFSSGTSDFYVTNQLIKELIICILNSSIFYWWWTLYSDGFHVTKEDIFSFPLIDINNISDNNIKKINFLYKELMNKYKNFSDYKSMRVLGKTVKIQSIEPYKFKDILLNIDNFLCDLYGLDFNYYITFDSKFRYDKEKYRTDDAEEEE